MLAGVAEDLAQQVGRAVDHTGLAGERRVRGDEPDNLDDPRDPVEVPDDAFHGRQGVDGAHGGVPLGGVR
ncbi:hypothetical protein D3C85_1939140 [compost metagenome]